MLSFVSFVHLFFNGESVPGRIQDPGVVVGALHAGVEVDCFPGQLAGFQRAGVGQRAVRLALNVTLLLPLLEVSQRRQLGGVLHPLYHLVEAKFT